MEASRVWKNLLSGKPAVPTVECPSCGVQVPEFRIHSHLDSCLTTLPPEEEAVVAAIAEVAHEFSDGGQNRHRKGRAKAQGRGRGKGRKRREDAESKKDPDGVTDGRKRPRGDNVEGDKGLDAPVFSEDEDDDASSYQSWEFTVLGFDELAKSRKEVLLSDLQKQELLASGVLTIERHEVSAMVLELDCLLDDTEGIGDDSSLSLPRFRNGNGFQIPAWNQIEQVSCSSARMNTADAEGHGNTQAEQGKALEAWWEQWVTVEWPEGALPSGFHPIRVFPNDHERRRSSTRIQRKFDMERFAAQETTLLNAHLALPRLPHKQNIPIRDELMMGSFTKRTSSFGWNHVQKHLNLQGHC